MAQVKQILNKNFAIIFFLAIAAGLPLALILSTLKAVLSDLRFDLKTIGFLSLIVLPYSLKIFYAPLIDSIALPFLTKLLGQRRSWILLTQLFLIIAIIFLGIAIGQNDLFLITVFSCLVAFFSSCQDIALDAYRIELFAKEDQGLGATFYTYGYRIGLLISGAFALFLADHINWYLVYLVMSLFMLIGVVTIFFAFENKSNHKIKKYNFISWVKNYIFEPFHDFVLRKKWYVILGLVIFFKLSDAFAGTLTIPFLLDLEFSKTEIAAIVKTFGLFATLFGILIGGILVKKIGNYKSLWIAGIAQMLSNLTFSYLALKGHDIEILYLTIFIENFSGGIGDAVFVAYLSILCNINFSATQYAALSSFATLSRSLLSASAGVFAMQMGWYNFFIFSTFLAIPGLIFLYFLRKL